MATGEHPLTEADLASSEVIQQLLARVDMVERRGIEQEKEIQILKSAMVQQQHDMEKLRSELQAKDRIIETLLRTSSKTDDDRTSTSEEMLIPTTQQNTSGSDNEEVKHQIHGGNGNRIRRQLENEATVAFSAGLSQHMTHVGDQQNIVFDQVITNIGNAYNSHNGVFVAPVSGVYVFHAHILSNNNNQPNYANIAVNGVGKALVYMHDNLYGVGSQSLIVQLNKGDNVAIHGYAGSAFHGWIPSYTTFSGFLLQQTYTPNVVG